LRWIAKIDERRSIAATGPSVVLLGKSDDDVRDSILDEARDLMDPFSAHDFGVKEFRFFEIPAWETYVAHARESRLCRRRYLSHASRRRFHFVPPIHLRRFAGDRRAVKK
jgi:hypothetical protein